MGSATGGGAATAADPELAAWLEEVTDEAGPFQLAPLHGGNSNETLLVTSRTARYVLRRPPAAGVDASAHSMEREYRILMALADTHVPVPRPVALAPDAVPGGPPALLMAHLDGVSIRDRVPPGYPAAAEAATAIGHAAVDALADLHSLPWLELGLEDFGRPDGFLERQVSRWRAQYERYRHRELPDFEIVATWLEENRPPDGEPGILHGDFHVDNCLFSSTAPARLLAIIDWEMATIGDPLLDLGLLLAFWGSERPEACAMPAIQGFSRVPGAPTRLELAERYARRSGRSVERLDYYMTLAFWKLAAVVEGAHAQFAMGILRTDYAEALGDDVPRLLAEARGFAGCD